MNANARLTDLGPAFGLSWSVTAALTVLAIFFAGIGSSQTIYEFNTPDDLTQNFVEAGVSPAMTFNHSSLPGVGGVPGRVEDVGTDTLFLNSPFDLSSSGTLQFSTFFLYNHEVFHPGRENDWFVKLGLSESASNAMYPSAASEYTSVTLVVGTGGLTRKLQLGTKVPGAAETDIYSTNFSLASGLYQLAASWTLTGPSTISCTATLSSHGSDGTGPPVELVNFSGTLANAGIASDSSIFAGINSTMDVTYIDNVSIVPEPAPYALLLPGFFLVAAFCRSRPKSQPAKSSP